MKKDWGRHLLGLCAVLLGVAALAWHQLTPGDAQRVLGTGLLYEIVLYAMAVVLIAGGIAVQIAGTLRAGALAIAAAFAVFAILGLAESAAAHALSTSWINLFETLGTFSGAIVLFARSEDSANARVLRATVVLFGICTVTYALAQIVYFKYTASLVPEWILPGQTFWTVLTTIAFALAALAMLTRRYDLLAAQLLALMIAIFGLTIWVPAAIAYPSKLSNWTELATNVGICSAAWILAERLGSAANAEIPAVAMAESP